MYPWIQDIQVSAYPSIQKKSVSKISKYPDIRKKWYPSIPTPGGPGGASIVERKDFQANGHCGDLMSQRTILMIVATIPKNMNTIKKNVKQND